MAINTPRNLARTAAATSSVTLYTVPASTTAVLTSICGENCPSRLAVKLTCQRYFY